MINSFSIVLVNSKWRKVEAKLQVHILITYPKIILAQKTVSGICPRMGINVSSSKFSSVNIIHFKRRELKNKNNSIIPSTDN